MREHLAIVKPVYARKILSGEKTIECRFSRVRRVPFGRVSAGDVVWFKRVSGRVVARCVAADVVTLSDLDDAVMDGLFERHGAAIGASRAVWDGFRGRRYGTLVWLRDVEEVGVGEGPDWRGFVKAGSRAGWVVMGE